MANQSRIEEIRRMFYTEMEISAEERNAMPFLLEARTTIPKIIFSNTDFNENGIFNTLTPLHTQTTDYIC